MKTPTCPRCGSTPWMVMGDGHQAFCFTDDCAVFTWDPAQSVEEFEATAREIELRPGDGSDRS